jgi:hypothetical protein
MKGIRYIWEALECLGATNIFGKYVRSGTDCGFPIVSYVVCEVAGCCRVNAMLVPVAAVGLRNHSH